MLRDIEEWKFRPIRNASMHRLSPDNLILFLIGILVFSGITSAVVWFALDYSTLIEWPVWPFIQRLDVALLSLQLLMTLFFCFPGQAYRYQKLQAAFLCLVVLKLPFDGYKIYFLSIDDRGSPPEMLAAGFVAIAIGLLLPPLLLLRASRKLRQDKATENGSYLYPVSRKTAAVIAGVIIVLFIVARLSQSFLNDSGEAGSIIGPLGLLLMFSLLQYAIAFAWPELLLLAYGKLKFDSFLLENPKRRHAAAAKQASPSPSVGDGPQPEPASGVRRSIAYWSIRPFAALKSRAWRLRDKAPFGILLLLWLKYGALLTIALVLLTLRNVDNRIEFQDNAGAYSIPFVFLGLFIAGVAMIVIQIVLGLIAMIRGAAGKPDGDGGDLDTAEPKEPSLIALIAIKFVQYTLFTFYVMLAGGLFAERVGWMWSILYIVIFIWHLKWMSRYPISNLGMSYISSLLWILSTALILMGATRLFGTTTFAVTPGTVIGIVAIVVPAIFWSRFNIIAALRKLSARSPQKNIDQ